jgi:hypothetical protein
MLKISESISSDDGGWNMEINRRIGDGKRMVGCLNSIWWDEHVTNTTKERLGRCLVDCNDVWK